MKPGRDLQAASIHSYAPRPLLPGLVGSKNPARGAPAALLGLNPGGSRSRWKEPSRGLGSAKVILPPRGCPAVPPRAARCLHGRVYALRELAKGEGGRREAEHPAGRTGPPACTKVTARLRTGGAARHEPGSLEQLSRRRAGFQDEGFDLTRQPEGARTVARSPTGKMGGGPETLSWLHKGAAGPLPRRWR